MPSIVTINASMAALSLAAGEAGTLNFDVANTSNRPMSLRSRILTAGDGAVPAWLNLSEGADLEIAPAETMRVSIAVTPPEGTNADLQVRLEVFEIALPEENVDRSAQVHLSVTAPAPEPVPERRRPRWLIPAIAAGAAILVTGGGVAWWATRGGLPDVTGLLRSQAEDILTEIPVRNVTYEMVGDDSLRPGTVVEQFPRRGTKTPEDLTVELDLAARPMPDFEGMNLAEALRTMADLNLRLGDVFPSIGSGVPHAAVTKTDPPAGTVVTGGQVVTVIVALSDGRSLDEAIDRNVLQTLGGEPFSVTGQRPDCPGLFPEFQPEDGLGSGGGTPACLQVERSFSIDGTALSITTF